MKKQRAVAMAKNGGIGAAAIIAAVFLIEPWEGEVKNSSGEHVVYIDATGTPTVCRGLTQAFVKEPLIKGKTFTEEQCLDMEVKALKHFEGIVQEKVKTDFKSVFQEAAFISFSWNSGAGNFSNSTMLRLKNEGKDELVCDQLLRWVYSKGVKLKGLENRRGDERRYCLGEVDAEVEEVYYTISEILGNPRIRDLQFKPSSEYVPINSGEERTEQKGDSVESYSQCQHSRFYCWISNSWRDWGKSSN